MNVQSTVWENELMEVEDQVHEELRVEFRQRLEKRLQDKVKAKEQALPEVRLLKKKRVIDLHLKSTLGDIRLRVVKGYDPQNMEWVVPIRTAWGLVKNQRLTPSLQRRICCTAVETGSFEKASLLAAEWGCSIRDEAIRSCVLALGNPACESPLSLPCADRAEWKDTLILMMDGWMARHRGKDWGKKKRVEGQERIHWHEIKSAVIYRLRDQATRSPKRRALLSKQVVAVPAQTDPVEFGRRVQDEARRMGLGKAQRVYVVMDGAVWLWNIFRDRFELCASGTLDFYHASQRLHELSTELFRDPQEAQAWSATILHSLKHHSPRKLFDTLAELLADPLRQEEGTQASIQSAKEYFENHREHMKYSEAMELGLPMGSGSMESQCSQFQNRFKRRGQFWMKEGFAGLLEVSVRHQNGELRSLWAA